MPGISIDWRAVVEKVFNYLQPAWDSLVVENGSQSYCICTSDNAARIELF